MRLHTTAPPLQAAKLSARVNILKPLKTLSSAGHLCRMQAQTGMSTNAQLATDTWELDEKFTGLANKDGSMTIAGFGSLLSERSARTTFPDLENFRPAKVLGWRRVFAHTADIFFVRGIANMNTKEISSLSVEPAVGSEIVVSLFEVAHTPQAVQAFIAREHEFSFHAVHPVTLKGEACGHTAVVCSRWNDEAYKAARCPPEEWQRRWAVHGIDRVWRDDVLPCRIYLRHCVLASQSLCPEAYQSFLDQTYLADRKTTVRQWLAEHPDIMQESPPPELRGRLKLPISWVDCPKHGMDG